MVFKIRSSILYALSILLLGTIIATTVAVRHNNIFQFYEQNIIYVTLSNTIKNETAITHFNLEALINKDPSVVFETDVISPLEKAKASIEKILAERKAIKKGMIFFQNHHVVYRLEDLQENIKKFRAITELRYQSAQDSNQTAQKAQIIKASFNESYFFVHESAENLTRYISELVAKYTEEKEQETIMISITIALFFYLLGFIIYYFEQKRIKHVKSRNIRVNEEQKRNEVLLQIIERMKVGNYELTTTYDTETKDPLYDKLNQMRLQLQESDENDRQRNFVQKGIDQVNNIIRDEFSDTNSEEGYIKIIKFLVEYLDFVQAGFYVIRSVHKSPYLELKAHIAYGRQKYDKKRLDIHEGLIGQCVQEKQSIFLKDIPQDYMQIVSGLGDMPPKNIIIVPLIHAEQVVGVIELSSLSEITSNKIQFLENSAKTIAVAVSSYRSNQRTKTLLTKAQSQAEQLRAQEEEMRQNSEELSATQEEMHRREKEYIEQINKLKAMQEKKS